MTIHIMTTRIRLKSRVVIHAPPGERSENVVRDALEQVKLAREEVGMTGAVTNLHISTPEYIGHRRWSVNVVSENTVSETVEV